MQNRLPFKIDVVKAAQKRLDYEGVYPAKTMERLASLVEQVDSDVKCRFSFGFDEQGLCVVTVDAKVEISLVCQRCNRRFTTQVCINNQFSPVKSEAQIEKVPDYYEPAILNEFAEVDMLALIEDEIILSLPIAPVHNDEDCTVSQEDFVFGEIPTEEDKPNPFAILTSLKNKE